MGEFRGCFVEHMIERRGSIDSVEFDRDADAFVARGDARIVHYLHDAYPYGSRVEIAACVAEDPAALDLARRWYASSLAGRVLPDQHSEVRISTLEEGLVVGISGPYGLFAVVRENDRDHRLTWTRSFRAQSRFRPLELGPKSTAKVMRFLGAGGAEIDALVASGMIVLATPD